LELFDQEVQNAMESFSGYERVKKFALMESEWTIESGEITPKMSVKRKVVENNYTEVIDHLYSS
jgi:long-chain acyl-CoA synthetase